MEGPRRRARAAPAHRGGSAAGRRSRPAADAPEWGRRLCREPCPAARCRSRAGAEGDRAPSSPAQLGSGSGSGGRRRGRLRLGRSGGAGAPPGPRAGARGAAASSGNGSSSASGPRATPRAVRRGAPGPGSHPAPGARLAGDRSSPSGGLDRLGIAQPLGRADRLGRRSGSASSARLGGTERLGLDQAGRFLAAHVRLAEAARGLDRGRPRRSASAVPVDETSLKSSLAANGSGRSVEPNASSSISRRSASRAPCLRFRSRCSRIASSSIPMMRGLTASRVQSLGAEPPM